MAGFDGGSWNIVFLPKGTPEPIVRKLNAAMSEAMDSADTEKRLLAIGIDIPPKDRRTPAYAAKLRRAGDQEIRRPDQGQRHCHRISGIPARHSAA